MFSKELFTNFAMSKDKRSIKLFLTLNLSMIEADEFEKEVEDLTAMLRSLRRIQDKGRRKFLKQEIRLLLNTLIHD